MACWAKPGRRHGLRGAAATVPMQAQPRPKASTQPSHARGGPAPALGMLVLRALGRLAQRLGAGALQPVAVRGLQRARGVQASASSPVGIQAGAQKRGLFGRQAAIHQGVQPGCVRSWGLEECSINIVAMGVTSMRRSGAGRGCAGDRCLGGRGLISSRMRLRACDRRDITSAHRNVQHARHVGVGHVLERHQQQHGALLGGQALQAAIQIQACHVVRHHPCPPVSPGPDRPAPAGTSSRAAALVQVEVGASA